MAISYRSRTSKPRSRYGKISLQPEFELTLVALVALLLLLIFGYNYQSIETHYYTVLGKPSISATFINRVLAWYNSPAAGKGQALYDDGVKYGIDPVYALAFFMHESRFGTTGVARFTRSLGNIRASAGYTQYEGFRKYRRWEDGFEDWYRLIARKYVEQWGLSTVDQIVPVYAPSFDDNDVTAYVAGVKQAIDTWRSGSIEV
jgi:Mannosyl-glycoprotein endo-beta-N-acetylglucosaminidase